MARNTEAIAENWAKAACEQGDFEAYARLRAEIAALEAEAARERRSDRRAESLQALLGLKPGDIVQVPGGRRRGWVVVIDPGTRSENESPRPLVLTEDRQVRRMSLADFPAPPVVAGRMRSTSTSTPRRPPPGVPWRPPSAPGWPRSISDPGPGAPVADEDLAAEIAERRIELRQHPCHSCPDRETHARWAEQALRLERENARLQERVDTRTNTIANHFDKICAVLESLGYLTGPGGGRVSEPGRMLARIYAELDLVAAECIRAGVFAGLSRAAAGRGAGLAGLRGPAQ